MWSKTTWLEFLFQNYFQMIETKFLQCSPLSFSNFASYAFYIENKFLLSKGFPDLESVGWLKLTVEYGIPNTLNCWLSREASSDGLFWPYRLPTQF